MSIAQLSHVLSIADPPPRIVGCLLPKVPDGTAARLPSLSGLGESAHDKPVSVLGDLRALPRVLQEHQIEQVLVSLPAAMGPRVSSIGKVLDQSGLTWRFLPMLADQLAGRSMTIHKGRGSSALGAAPGVSIDPVDLLGRRPQPIDHNAIARTLTGKTVMITGAGGSIGSELARIVARFEPARLVLLERSENALFEIDRQIASVWPNLHRAAVLHDVTDAQRTNAVVNVQQPNVIFHAAAHKHVPMMEDHPSAAVENNFYGTRSIADAASRAGVERFVMISSDKAVNPSSVMGATKRLAELYIQYLQAHTDTSTIYSMVRFGNVLGSACSVLPIWSQQLAQGSPITVTHKDMSRYFMTIPEAAGLVLQSGALSTGGETFLLDMGEPSLIMDLAKRFVRCHGLEPDIDVPIEITGIRPGEKLFEELAYESEEMVPTDHASIRIWRTVPPAAERMQAIIHAFDALRTPQSADHHIWQNASRESILSAIRHAVPEMKQPTKAAIAG